MIYEYKIDGLWIKTGDLICTTDGGENLISGQFWRLIGKLIPGKVDHIAIYVGPGGQCIEAGAKGCVISFEVTNNEWNAVAMEPDRNLIDELHGVAYPLQSKNYSDLEENRIRESVADYCFRQAESGKPYNLNFLNSHTEEAFYCSQLAYIAYLPHGIDLNTSVGIPHLPGTESIIFPQEIWSGCFHVKA